MTEDPLETKALRFVELGHVHRHGAEIAPDGPSPEPSNYRQAVLRGRLTHAIHTLNPNIPARTREDALAQVLDLCVPVQYQKDDKTRGNFVRLERDGLQLSQGRSRGKVYHVPGTALVTPEQVFSGAGSSGSSEASSGSIPTSPGNREGSEPGADNAASASPQRDAEGCLLSPLLDAPIVDDLDALSDALKASLLDRARLPRNKARLDPETMTHVILSVCDGRYVRLSVLAELLRRDPDGLRKGYLDGLVEDQLVRRAFPGAPTHELQSYRKDANGKNE